MSEGCLVKRAVHIAFFVFLISSLNIGSGWAAGAGLTPITEPPNAYVLPSNLCGLPDASAGLQAALNAAAGGALWIPDGCIVNTYATSLIPSNTTIACGQGTTIHSTVPLSCSGEPSSLTSEGASNITVEGCTFTGNYTFSIAAQINAMCGPVGLWNGSDPADFYSGSNITFTDNAVTNLFGMLLFDQNSNVTVSNNYFAQNYGGMQISNCKNCNVTGNTSLDSGWAVEDAWALPAGYDTVSWSNNVFACDSTGEGAMVANSGNAAYYGGHCVWKIGGCSVAVCTPGEYSNVGVQNNTITGPASTLLTSPSMGTFPTSNSFTNGAYPTTR